MYPVYQAYKRTSDNFCGNFKVENSNYIELVEVMYHGNIALFEEEEIYRVSVWGDDDCGMEYDTPNKEEAIGVFMDVIGLKAITFDKLKKLGFKSA
jgi:hypothetical protein